MTNRLLIRIRKSPVKDRRNERKRISITENVGKYLLPSPPSIPNAYYLTSLDLNILDNEASANKGAIKKADTPIPARPSNPLRYKTELCRAHDEGGFCRFGVACTFAHGTGELRAVPRHHKYKTEPCRSYHSIGYCQYGTRCHFVHDPEDTSVISSMVKPTMPGQYERSGTSAANFLEYVCMEDKSKASNMLMNLHNLCALQGRKEGDDFSLISIPELSLDSPLFAEKCPTFMDICMPLQEEIVDNSLLSVNSPTFMDFCQPSLNEKRTTKSIMESPDVEDDFVYNCSSDLFLESKLNGSNINKTRLRSISTSSWSSCLSTSLSDDDFWKEHQALTSPLLYSTEDSEFLNSFFSSFDKFLSRETEVTNRTAVLSSSVAEAVIAEITAESLEGRQSAMSDFS